VPEFGALGFTVRWVDQSAGGRAGHFIAEHKGKKGTKRLLLIGHLDTVFELDHPFQKFERISTDKVKGPGAADDKGLVRLEAMMSSMTAKERARPEIINAKRKIRVAKGSGTTVQEVKKLLKMHKDMETAMKRLKKMGGFGKLAAMFSQGGMEKALGGMMPGGAMPGGLPGLGGPGGLPPGFDKFGKK